MRGRKKSGSEPRSDAAGAGNVVLLQRGGCSHGQVRVGVRIRVQEAELGSMSGISTIYVAQHVCRVQVETDPEAYADMSSGHIRKKNTGRGRGFLPSH